jgi:hypothetical protein
VRFADLSISRGVTLSRPSQTFGSQRFVAYSVLYKWVFLLELFVDTCDSNLFVLCAVTLQFLSHPLLSELLTEEDQKVFPTQQFTTQSLEIMNIELESKRNFLK